MSVLRRLGGLLSFTWLRSHAPPPEPPLPAVSPAHEELPATPRTEALVVAMLVLASVAAIVFVVVYFADGSTQLLGAALGGCLLFLAAAMIAAGKLVVPQIVEVEPRPEVEHPEAPDEADHELRRVGEGINRRGLLLAAGGAATASIGAAAAVPLLSLAGPTGQPVGYSPWREGMRLVDDRGRPIRPDELAVGSFVTAVPEGQNPESFGAPLMVVNIEAGQIHPAPGREGWAVGGVQAFSKTCTHAGCAVAMLRYPLDADLAPGPALVCPCHYSAFDVAHAASVVFGPAGRPLPQLPLRLGSDGSLEAAGPLSGPVGPSYWSVRE
jgi:ubiquinol-cytochrome c reductase iron-sulfur subunit